MSDKIRLNMGCGNHPKIGYINVDKFPCAADTVFDANTLFVQLDLEAKGSVTRCSNGLQLETHEEFDEWPWDDNSVDEVVFHHSLEHMGEQVDGFFHILKEVYRICKPDAYLLITVPHPRHDDFMNDPTHVRAITGQQMMLFNQEDNRRWIADGSPNTPLGLQLGIDFVLDSAAASLEPKYDGYPKETLERMMEINNNIIKQVAMRFKVRK